MLAVLVLGLCAGALLGYGFGYDRAVYLADEQLAHAAGQLAQAAHLHARAEALCARAERCLARVTASLQTAPKTD